MGFHLYDRRQWPRSKYYDYYRNIIKTRYTLTDEIDVKGYARLRAYT